MSGDQGGNMRQRWCPAGEVLKRRGTGDKKKDREEKKMCVIKQHQYV